MASTEGLKPITREFLASYYEKHQFPPISDDVSRLSSQINSLVHDLLQQSAPSQDESLLVDEANRQAPHKVDENLWKNREQIEEMLFLLERSRWPAQLQQPSTADTDVAVVLGQLKDKLQNTFDTLVSFQKTNSDRVFNTVMTYMPQDFRGKIIRLQKERSERNKQAEVDALVSSGGSIRDRYALLWKQQMDRRRQLALLGSATGVYKTLVTYLVGVPQVLLDFVQKINDDDGPMEEQRARYGPPLYSLTKMALLIRLFLSVLFRRSETSELEKGHADILSQAVSIYCTEFKRFIAFISEVFVDSPFFISAEEAGAFDSSEEYKEISVPAGRTYEVSLTADSINSYIAWDFALVQGKMTLDIGFSVEYINGSGEKILILPYRRYESDQGNFSTVMAGNYKLVWDNSYSNFFKKTLRYKVDCIPPVVEPSESKLEE